MNDEERARILVEGGPFYQRVVYSLMAAAGVVVGIIVAIVILFAAIHQSRVASARFSCENTDREHNETVLELENKLTKLEVEHPDQKLQLSQTKAFTISLINALAPERGDCNKYANEVVK